MAKESLRSPQKNTLSHSKTASKGSPSTQTNLPADTSSLTPENIVQLQQMVGNQAVMQLLRDNGHSIQREPDTEAPAATEEQKVDPKVAIKKAAEALVETGGSGTDADVEVVVAEMIKIPLTALKALKEEGIKVVVCHDSVTEVRTDLQGVTPRGWPAGKTWDSVPGLYDPGNKRVIIATRDGKVPADGDGHGAHNLVLHEVGHAIGKSVEAGGEADPKFIEARDKDEALLDDYEGQAGNAGVQETYAESFARFYGEDANDAATYPNLHAYWASDPFVADAE